MPWNVVTSQSKTIEIRTRASFVIMSETSVIIVCITKVERV